MKQKQFPRRIPPFDLEEPLNRQHKKNQRPQLTLLTLHLFMLQDMSYTDLVMNHYKEADTDTNGLLDSDEWLSHFKSSKTSKALQDSKLQEDRYVRTYVGTPHESTFQGHAKEVSWE